MTQKQLIKTLKHLIKILAKDKPCKELNWDCACCKSFILKAGLEWWLDLEIWGSKTKKKSKCNKNIK